MSDNKKNFQSISSLFESREKNIKKKAKPPAYQWQELALTIIKELNIPAHKRSSVFRVCKINSPDFIKRCITDTKELCDKKKGTEWQYFFKLINNK